MSRRPNWSVGFAVALSVASAIPSGAETLTLKGAMAAAREHAGETRAARARTMAAGERLRQARAYRKPRVGLQEIWTRTDSPAEAFGLILNQERFSLADFAAGDPNDPAVIENALTRIELELPVYTGGEIRGRIRQAELARDSTTLNAAWSADRAAYEAAEAYIQLIRAREAGALLERTLETVSAHVDLARAYVDQGFLVRSEVLRAEVEQARIRELLAEAQGRERIAGANLTFRLGASPLGAVNPGSEELADRILEALALPPPLERALEDFLAGAEERPDLEAARRQLEAGGLEEAIVKSALLPRVGLLARHDRYDDSLLGASGDSTAVVAVASIELFGGGRYRAAAASARWEAEAARFEVELLREGIRLEIRVAYERAVTARERQATASATLVAAREAERIVRERFDQGVAKTLDVLDALTALREAETRELMARAEAHLASLRLAMSAGLRPESALDPTFGGGAPDPSNT